MISPAQRPLRDNTQQTDAHAAGGIRTRSPSKRTAADPRLRPHCCWGQRISVDGERTGAVKGRELGSSGLWLPVGLVLAAAAATLVQDYGGKMRRKETVWKN